MKNIPRTALEQACDETSLQIIADLRELIVALDRRVPRLERTGELAIVREAAALKRAALARIGTLKDSDS